ncbi:MAG TPA: hypothetical protein VFP21_05515 [Solirubrobacterales bacterium]|nr:hypothetical protein [Solirubrobacterales bacterium]
MQRTVLDDGQVFFQTKNPLSPQDVNGNDDVYVYRNGVSRLISSGTGFGGSVFLDASIDGSDVFFASGEALVSSDADGGRETVYDARVDGGFPEPGPPDVPCGSDEACRSSGAIPPPSVAGSATSTFAGAGNPRPQRCRRGTVRRGNRCVKKAKRHRRHGHSGNPRRSGSRK